MYLYIFLFFSVGCSTVYILYKQMYYVVRFMQFYLYVCFPPNKLGHESSTLEVQKAIPLGQGIKARIDVSCNLVAFRQYCQTATYVQPLSSAFKQKQVLRRRLSYDESGRMVNILLGDGNSNIFDVHPEIGEDSHFDYYFSNRLVQPPTRLGMLNFCKKYPIIYCGGAGGYEPLKAPKWRSPTW